MTINTNISELKTYSAKSAKDSKPKLDHIIKLYEDRQIASFKSALNTVLYIGKPVGVVNGRDEQACNGVVANIKIYRIFITLKPSTQ